MDLSIIISTYNRGKIFTQTLLAAIEAVKHIPAEIIVVNDVKGEEIILPRSETVLLTLVRNTKPGVASKRNLGASLSKAKLLLFLDDDIVISKESIDHIIKLHSENDNICVNPSWIYPFNLTTQLKASSFGRFMIRYNLVSFKGWYGHPSWKDNALFSSKSIASFHLSISREDFIKSGGYNEGFKEAGFEDYDFPLRLKRINMEFLIDTRIQVFHNEEDRVTLDAWLIRQQRGAFTRAEAVALGYNELILHYNYSKKAIFLLLDFLKPSLFILLRGLSQLVFFDVLSFRIILLLQAQSIYKGYTNRA
jgi:GT2 family glycosyltransferase